MANMYSMRSVCSECGEWMNHNSKQGMCPRCRKWQKIKDGIKTCDLEGCGEKFEAHGNRKWCFKHKFLSPSERKSEERRIKMRKERGMI